MKYYQSKEVSNTLDTSEGQSYSKVYYPQKTFIVARGRV